MPRHSPLTSSPSDYKAKSRDRDAHPLPAGSGSRSARSRPVSSPVIARHPHADAHHPPSRPRASRPPDVARRDSRDPAPARVRSASDRAVGRSAHRSEAARSVAPPVSTPLARLLSHTPAVPYPALGSARLRRLTPMHTHVVRLARTRSAPTSHTHIRSHRHPLDPRLKLRSPCPLPRYAVSTIFHLSALLGDRWERGALRAAPTSSLVPRATPAAKAPAKVSPANAKASPWATRRTTRRTHS